MFIQVSNRRLPFSDDSELEGFELVFGDEFNYLEHRNVRSSILTIGDLPLGPEALAAWEKTSPGQHLTPRALIMAGALGSPESFRKATELLGKLDKVGPLQTAGSFVDWFISVGAALTSGNMGASGRDPEAVVDFVSHRVMLLVTRFDAGRYIGAKGFRINAVNRWLAAFGWRCEIRSAENAEWGRITIS